MSKTGQDIYKIIDKEMFSLKSSLTTLLERASSTGDNPREKMSALERTKFDLCLTYVANSLFYVNLKLKGAVPADHPIMHELSCVKTRMMSLGEIEISLEKAHKLDVDVVKRLLDHQIGKSGD